MNIGEPDYQLHLKKEHYEIQMFVTLLSYLYKRNID